MTEASRAVFLSYASQDAEAARRIYSALRAAGIDAWIDESEIRGGDAWDRRIRQQIHTCALFMPIISAQSQTRLEGYFRREWKLAVDRTHDMAEEKPFLVPVVIDDTSEKTASVPDKFREMQWTHLPAGKTPASFVERVSNLLLSTRAPPIASTSSPFIPRLTPSASTPQNRWIALAIAAFFVIAISYIAFRRAQTPEGAIVAAPTPSTQSDHPSEKAISKKSVAVLPFVDMSEKKDKEYFADGMAEEIRDILSTIPQLRVMSRSSSFQFRGQSIDLKSVGAQLGVAYALEGSVRASGQRVRVAAQLVDTRDGTEVWSSTYERDIKDSLILQEEIAAALARGLQVSIGADELQTQTSLSNGEAYEAYLRGRHALDRFNQEGFDEAIVQFERALKIDPTFAKAAEALALSRTVMAQWGITQPREAFEAAREAAQTALRLNPHSSLGHAAMMGINLVYDWNWQAAERQRDEALRSDPQNSYVLAYASHLAMARGDCAEALRVANAALAIDPLWAPTHVTVGWIQSCIGNYVAAESAIKRAMEISPDYLGAHFYLGKALLVHGLPQKALPEMMLETPQGGKATGLALTYFALGRKADADAALSHMTKEADWAYEVALVYAYRGEKDLAFEWLNKAYEQKDVELYLFRADPLLHSLLDDPRYKAFLRKMNLPG